MVGDSNGSTRGKARLDSARYAVDLSGKDFEDIFVDSKQTLSHSFLNGSSFKGSIFVEAPIDQTELAEAEIQHCAFKKNDFTGSSFIGARISDTIFQDCNFTDGEWRKSRFQNVIFSGCDFNYTTVNLCIFDNCEFRGPGAKKLDNRSVNYNVFTRSPFDFTVADEVVLASNYGLPAGATTKSLARHGASISLEEICLKSVSGKIVISELIDAIENEFRRADGHRLKILRLEFVSNIITALGTISKISGTSLTYLEGFFLTLARSVKSETDALAAMSVLLNIRNLLADITDTDYSKSEYAYALCRGVDIRYERTYTQAEAETLARILGELAHNDPNTFAVSRYAKGSTILDLVAVGAVTVGVTLMAINFAIRQANVTLVRAREMTTNTIELIETFSAARKKLGRRKPRSRVPALQRSGGSTKEVASLRRLVADHGRAAVDFDDEAEIVLRYIPSK